MAWDRHYNRGGAWRHRGLYNFSALYSLGDIMSKEI
jgi:hypothetical protein